jgi:NAD(P)-dependent dehydrogenase (short-subunit alcohol dehydrogenase family)
MWRSSTLTQNYSPGCYESMSPVTCSAPSTLFLTCWREGGVIINTSSAAGVLAELIRLTYGTSKAAIIGLTRNIATQYGRQGIRSVAIAPGIILTPAVAATVPAEMQNALLRHSLVPRPGQPEDIGYTVAFLMADEASFITGITIPVDGGLTVHFPSYAEELEAQSGNAEASS